MGALLLAVLIPVCGREGPEVEAPKSVVRDSAGVRIVENGSPPATEWRVGPQPLFTVGWDSDGPNFTWPQSGRILPDGGALIGEFGKGAIYRIGPGGALIETWGRKGEGPGEYQGLDAILLRGDSILVSDGRLRRVTVLSADGKLHSTRRLPGAFLHQISATLSDGRLLLIPGDAYGVVAETSPEWIFERQPILTADLENRTVDTLAVLPHLRRWYGTRGGSPGPVVVKGRAGGFSDGFAWARADEREVRWYDSLGRLVQVARWNEEPASLTPEWRRRMAQIYEEAYRSRGAEGPAVAARLADLDEELDRHEGPLPYWSSFHVDRLGNVWLGEYTLPGQPPRQWRVLTRDDSFIGWVDLAGVVGILDITDDRVLAVRHDELDVPAVQMIELIKP